MGFGRELGRIVLASALAGLIGGPASGEDMPAAAPAPSAPPPVWTLQPTRIDPSTDTLERMPPRIRPADERKRLVVDEFPRLERDGSFLAGGRRWRLAHVDLPDRGKFCPLEGGRRWPCGVRAWAFVSGLLAGAKLMCDPPQTDAGPYGALTCWKDGKSIAERIVAAGWAEPSVDAPDNLLNAYRRARASKRGLFSSEIPP